MESLGKLLLVVGGLLVIAGALIYAGPSLPSLPPLGKLPGDIRIERPGSSFYFPITTCILLSAVMTLLLYLFSRLR